MRSATLLLQRCSVFVVVLGLLAMGGAATAQKQPEADAPSAAEPAALVLSGRVYDGATGSEPPNSLPLAGVKVELWGAINPYPQKGDLIATTYTNSDGWYGLTAPEGSRYEFLHIIETNPSGYTSNGARSVGGTVRTADWIEYVIPLTGKVLTGNKFWDRPTISRTPTRTATATSTRTRTPTFTATPRVTLTPTPTLGQSVTPSPTRTAGPSATPSLTPTRGPTTSPTITRPPEGDADMELLKVLSGPLSGLVKPGDQVGFRLEARNHGPAQARDVLIVDYLPAGLKFVAASPNCILISTNPDVVHCIVGDLPPGAGSVLWLQAAVFDDACDELINDATVFALNYDPDGSNNGATAAVTAPPCPEQPLVVTKTLLDPPGGTVDVGGVAVFEIQAQNPGATPVTFDLEDTFLVAEFGFISAQPPPTDNLSDGIHHSLVWRHLTLPPGGTFSATVRLRALVPGQSATNCAHYIPVSAVGAIASTGPLSCATVRVRALEGKQALVTKRFTVPANHVAQVGDWLSFETQWLNVGTEAATKLHLHDAIVPPGVSSVLPVDFWWFWTFQTGGGAKVAGSLKAQAPGLPAVNTADWTATWADGTKTTQSASDYVYILDGEQGKGLMISKTRIEPPGDLHVGNVVIFRIAITNVTGVDLPVVALEDTFPAACLSYVNANIPPDSVSPGVLRWNNVGPLPLGASFTVEVALRAEAPCPNAVNCAVASYQVPGAQPMYAVACAPVTILGERPELRVVKRHVGPSPVMVGDLAEWEIRITNVGSAPIFAVPLHDGYQAAYLHFVSASPPPTSVDLPNGRLDWANLGPLAPGQTHTVALRLEAIQPRLGATNCAEARYVVGASPLVASDCATVDILREPPAIRILKERLAPVPAEPATVGDTVTFRLTVQNVGPMPLTRVWVEDHFDPACLEFLVAPSMATFTGPGVLRWDLPDLAPGGSHTWEVIFRAIADCPRLTNCAVAHGEGPEGQPALDETCVELGLRAAQPGLDVRKRLASPARLPGPGTVVRFELEVRNTGNLTLDPVPVEDTWDADCLNFIAAQPAPDGVDVAGGRIHWINVGPLAPGHGAVLSVYLRITGECHPGTWNCVRAWWEREGELALDDMDCVDLPIGAGLGRLYLPVILKQR